MKKTIRSVLSALLIMLMLLSLCSCNVFKTMRENAEASKNMTILETPEDGVLLGLLADYSANSVEKAISATESISYSAGNPDIFGADGEEAGLLDASAKQLRDLIKKGKPGSSSRDITADDIGLLAVIKTCTPVSVDSVRPVAERTVTLENGDPVTNDDGTEKKEEYFPDNNLNVTFNFFDTKVVDTVENDDGEQQEVTEIVPPDAAAIKEVFGEDADKEAVIAAFECIADYIELKDYEIEYSDCKISSVLDLDEEIVNYVKFEKNMNITAKAEGKGVFADYGELTICFRLTKTTDYSFTHSAE